MKAAVYTKYGLPDVLEIREVAKPIPKDNEVLIKVYATTVNRTVCAMLSGKPFIMKLFLGLFKPKVPILGTDFSGMVEAIGEDVTSFRVGNKVFGLNTDGLQSHAEYLVMADDRAIAIIPENINYEQATASLEGTHYAYNIINKVKIEEGQKILVNGATGAIGSATVQLLKYYGVEVTAVCNTKNFETVKTLGADWLIDYQKEDFTKTDQKYDYVFDTVGKSTFGKCKPLLVPKGVYISSELGPMAQNLYLALITPLMGRKKVVFPIPFDCKRSLLLVKELMEKGKFMPLVDKQYTLEEIADAYRYVETGEKTGNVVINISS
jgi:NADPH:quinone reductase-like Zn-dependent oxidoreductase